MAKLQRSEHFAFKKGFLKQITHFGIVMQDWLPEVVFAKQKRFNLFAPQQLPWFFKELKGL